MKKKLENLILKKKNEIKIKKEEIFNLKKLNKELN
jgi:hypothetical protein